MELNRTRLRVWEWGDPEAPPVLFAHGAYDHGRMFDGLAPRVAAFGHRAVALDLRGHGDSGRVATGHQWSATVTDLALLVRDHLGGGPVGAIGHSMGGGLCTSLAASFPELVRWVVGLDSLGGGPGRDETDLIAITREAFDAIVRGARRGTRVHASRADMAERRGAINVRLPPEAVDHLVAHGSRAVEGGFVWKSDPRFASGVPTGFNTDIVEHEAVRVAVPVLFLSGGEPDTWSEHHPEEIARRAAWYPDARHVVVPGAGHYPHVENLDFVVDAIERFLTEVA